MKNKLILFFLFLVSWNCFATPLNLKNELSATPDSSISATAWQKYIQTLKKVEKEVVEFDSEVKRHLIMAFEKFDQTDPLFSEESLFRFFEYVEKNRSTWTNGSSHHFPLFDRDGSSLDGRIRIDQKGNFWVRVNSIHEDDFEKGSSRNWSKVKRYQDWGSYVIGEIIESKKNDPEQLELFRHEKVLLKRITDYYDHAPDAGRIGLLRTESIEDDYLIQERFLEDMIQTSGRGLDLIPRLEIFEQIIQGTITLHHVLKINHLDLKPENVLFKQIRLPDGTIQYRVAITDFEVAVAPKDRLNLHQKRQYAGTLEYAAPEILDQLLDKLPNLPDLFLSTWPGKSLRLKELYSYKADVHSLGVFFYLWSTFNKLSWFQCNDIGISVPQEYLDCRKTEENFFTESLREKAGYKRDYYLTLAATQPVQDRPNISEFYEGFKKVLAAYRIGKKTVDSNVYPQTLQEWKDLNKPFASVLADSLKAAKEALSSMPIGSYWIVPIPFEKGFKTGIATKGHHLPFWAQVFSFPPSSLNDLREELNFLNQIRYIKSVLPVSEETLGAQKEVATP